MPNPAPNPEQADLVRAAVQTMPAARWLGITVGPLGEGVAEIVLPVRPDLTQHDGHVAGYVLGALADLAGGSAAATLLPPGWVSLTGGYTLSIVAPARGDRLVARGRTVPPGRSSSVAAADVLAVDGDDETLCATALVTMRNVKVG
ncbi:PaaI family thioesterase [Pseudonocardia sp. ICBG1142]|uniref:PaaI family thioesterase n=1 Tax=Pseudonocardia sp. ICBG1142 TaxID=2846760 RepID=UPI001CF64C23|nr:PaaI family thioesterase [Pseudonocardia sp. ICBG1142]